jgi:hypothetical protein
MLADVIGADAALTFAEYFLRFVPWVSIIFAFTNWEEIKVFGPQLLDIK